MDANIENYLILLSENDQHLVKTFLKCSTCKDIEYTFPQRNIMNVLIEYPYPVMPILLRQWPSKSDIIKPILLKALEKSLNNITEKLDMQFVIFLLLLPQDVFSDYNVLHIMESFKNIIKARPTLISNELYLTLCSSTYQTQWSLFIYNSLKEAKWQYCENGLPSREYILYQALECKRHFIIPFAEDLVEDRLDMLPQNKMFTEMLVVMKLLYIFLNCKKFLKDVPNLSSYIKYIECDTSIESSSSIYKQIKHTLKRWIVLCHFMQKKTTCQNFLTIHDIIKCPTILDATLLCKTTPSYEDLRSLIELAYHPDCDNCTNTTDKENELEKLNYYFILYTVFDMIAGDNYANDLDEQQHLNENVLTLNSLLRQIVSFEYLCQVLEDILQLIFTKREYINKDSKESIPLRQVLSDSSYSDEEYKAHRKRSSKFHSIKNKSMTYQTGFMCSRKALQYILNCLKTFVTIKYHSNDYKSSALVLQQRFQQIIDNINHIFWKLSIVEQLQQCNKENCNSKYTSLSFQVKDEKLLNVLMKYHKKNVERSSSDDDEDGRYSKYEHRDNNKNRKNIFRYHTQIRSRRKKIPKARRATFGGSVPSSLHNIQDPSVCNFNRITPVMKRTLSSKLMANQKNGNDIIPKILYSVEQLANIALSLKHYNDAKRILEDSNLHDSSLYAVLNFVEQQQQVKNKLLAIYNNYQQIEKEIEKSQEPLTTVEQIRRVAVKGFEVSKIISVIDNFVQTQTSTKNQTQAAAEVHQAEHSNDTFNKHNWRETHQQLLTNNKILNNFNAIVTFDLIIDLPLNYDMVNTILSMIKRQREQHFHHQEQQQKAATNLEVKLLPIEMCDCLTFLENLRDCMHLLEDKVSLKDIFCNNTYSLRSESLTLELEREKIFYELFNTSMEDLKYYEDLKKLSPQFRKLKPKVHYYERFCSYISHLNKLLQLRNLNSNYTLTELLETIDPYIIIGELIFTCNVTPLEIEGIVKGLNLNLVHAVALNICPEVGGRHDIKKQSLPPTKFDTVINYVENHNRLLAYLLRGIIDGNYLPNIDGINGQYMERILQMPEIKHVSSLLYNGNKMITALLSDNIITSEILDQIGTPTEMLELLELEIGLQESYFVKQRRIDNLIAELINEQPQMILLCAKVTDITLRVQLIQKYFMKIPTLCEAKQLIESTLHHKDAQQELSENTRNQLKRILTEITVYAKICEVMNFETWVEAYAHSRNSSQHLFHQLLQKHLYKLTYDWCKIVKLAENFELQRKVFFSTLSDIFVGLNDDNYTDEVNTFHYLQLILQTFPQGDCIEFLMENLDKIRSVQLLRYSLKYLSNPSNTNTMTDTSEKYRNYKISLLIFEHLSPSILKQFWNLLKYPLLVIEQLIMNTKFEILNKILPHVRNELQRNDDHSDKGMRLCEYCYDKRGHIYDINSRMPNVRQKSQFQLGVASSCSEASFSAFILLNFNLYQQNHYITNDCIDLLLRLYATKALDYHVSNGSSEPQSSQSIIRSEQSLDSLCGEFRIPMQAPQRSEWVQDEDVTTCMCCRCTFTMFIRRHHCRRCGRVICFACSPHRMRIPELYEDVEVRVCVDCHRLTNNSDQCSKSTSDSTEYDCTDILNDGIPINSQARPLDRFKWRLSGNITHDKLLREEFCYEHTPSVALCLAILDYHMENKKCVEHLLYHCRKLEKLIIPNPEVDYELVAKMMNCLALAAKVRGAPAEVETLRLHSEIIISVVQNGCESYIPPDLLISKLADSLIQSEHWELALEVHLKCGLPTTGVMAAHGLSCLRAGCFETAREKFSHCMPKLIDLPTNAKLRKLIFGPILRNNGDNGNDSENIQRKYDDLEIIRRPSSSPALLKEILELIKSLPIMKPQPETLMRASIIRNSNTSLASLLSTKRKDSTCVKRTYEPALNILNTLANLKAITQGQYMNLASSNQSANSSKDFVQRKQLFRQSRAFDECLYYILTYASHADIIQFLLCYNDIKAALNYYLVQQLERDLFVHYIYLESLRNGWTPQLIGQLKEYDNRLVIWRSTLLYTCRYLENQKHYNCLYQLQLLVGDPIRAAMTCVKFYTMDCNNFQQQHLNAQHLSNARLHLQSELELSKWEHINIDTLKPLLKRCSSRRSSTSSTTTNDTASGANAFILKMDARSLNFHINTIIKQLEVAKFLANCEKMDSESDQENTNPITQNILKQIRNESPKSLPTLFDNTQEKIEICILLLLCGKNFDEGFGLAYRIMQDYKLSPIRVYAATAKYLSRNQRLNDVEKLLHCVTTNNEIENHEIDEIIWVSINSADNNYKAEVKITLDNLVGKLHSIEMRISAHIFLGQLKSAYLLANKYERINDIRKILRHAEATNQIHIKKLCEKKLQLRTSTSATTLTQLQRS